MDILHVAPADREIGRTSGGGHRRHRRRIALQPVPTNRTGWRRGDHAVPTRWRSPGHHRRGFEPVREALSRCCSVAHDSPRPGWDRATHRRTAMVRSEQSGVSSGGAARRRGLSGRRSAFDREVVLSLAIALALTILTIFITRRFLQLLALTEAAGQLTAQRRLFAALIDTPSALCAVLDRDGRILYSNGRFDQVLKDAVASPNVFEHDSVRGGGEVLRFASSSERDSIELDLRLENDAARPRYLRFSLSRQALPGLGNCTVMVGHDETARHEVQQSLAQSAKLATLGELTTGIAHEITQPLNVMRMAAQNALMEVEAAEEAPEGASAEAQKDFRAFISGKLNRIVSQVDRAADIVSRMRIFGRAPKGPPIEFDVRDACRAALSMIEGRAKSADVTIVTELGEQPLNVRGHRNLIEMVMINLLLNARDALESSTKPRRTITVSATRAETGRVRLIVADNGPGVPASIRDRIFEPFFTGKPTGKGVGLGLATSYGIIHDAGGSLSLLQGDDGATFQIELPAASD